MNLDEIQHLVQAVQLNQRYHQMDSDLIRRLVEGELHKGRAGKAVVKAVRNKLHQVGSAYQETGIPYASLAQTLAGLTTELHSAEIKDFCRSAMYSHTSTRERLPILDQFYTSIFTELEPPSQILDAACGLHPLAVPWMPLPTHCTYSACDIYSDMVDFINGFLTHFNLPGKAFSCDLTSQLPALNPDTVFLLKTIPVLDQLQSGCVETLLDKIPAKQWVISFPAQSLSGRSKGMQQNYARRFQELVQSKPWQVKRLDFPGELVYVVKK
jgi:16S rRNA (guanine(1405)-N(7))-methyltransferase